MLSATNEAAAHRRIEFLLAEARHPHSIADSAVRYALRSVSNYYTVGRDAPSRYLYKYCPFRSGEAHRLLGDPADANNFHLVTNEHQQELNVIWRWMKSSADKLTVPVVAERFRRWPMVVISTQENNDLRQRWAVDTPPNPYIRYEEVNIMVLARVDGQWVERPFIEEQHV
jgi:hypothetical protein